MTEAMPISPVEVPVEIIDDTGRHLAEFAVTPREAIVLGAAVVGAETRLVNSYPEDAIQQAESQLKGAIMATTTRNWQVTGHAAMEADPEESARNYVYNVQGKSLTRPFLGEEPEAHVGETADEEDDAVKMSPEDLFDDADEDEPAAVTGPRELERLAKEVAMNAEFSKEGKTVIEADQLLAEAAAPAISVRTARIVVDALKARAAAVPDEALQAEFIEIEHKVEKALDEAPIPVRVRLAERFRGATTPVRLAGVLALASVAKLGRR